MTSNLYLTVEEGVGGHRLLAHILAITRFKGEGNRHVRGRQLFFAARRGSLSWRLIFVLF
jgi:hypothetical protein